MRKLVQRSHFTAPELLKAAISVFALCAATHVQAGEFTNFIGIKLVDIPAGSFRMGSCKVTKELIKENRKRVFLEIPPIELDCQADGRNVNDNETPQHLVNIQAFRMGATHVTLGQFNKYLAAVGAADASTGWNIINDEFKRLNSFGDNAPVVQVSWHEAKEFIEWINASKPADDHHIYRLASEAEWEYSCNAGEVHAYCGSDNLNEVGWVDRENNPHQRDVATKKPNAWGLYDMTGNVWEWVEDAYHENYVGAPNDGRAWTARATANAKTANPDFIFQSVSSGDAAHTMHVNSTAYTEEQRKHDEEMKAMRGMPWKRDTVTSRVLRGGSWRFDEGFARATYRLSGEPGNWYYGNGFRIAATLPKAD